MEYSKRMAQGIDAVKDKNAYQFLVSVFVSMFLSPVVQAASYYGRY